MFKTLLLVGCATAALLNGVNANKLNDTKSGTNSLRAGQNSITTQNNGVDTGNSIARKPYNNNKLDSSREGETDIDNDSQYKEQSQLAPDNDQEELSGKQKREDNINDSKDISDQETDSNSGVNRNKNPDNSKLPKLYVNDINRLDLSTKESAKKVLDQILDYNRQCVDDHYALLKEYKAVKEAQSNNDTEKLKTILKQFPDPSKLSAKWLENHYEQSFSTIAEELRLSNRDYFSIVDYLKATNKY